MDLEGLSRLGFDPFSIDVGHILFEKRWVIQLAVHISRFYKAVKAVLKAGRTGGMLWFGAMAYVLARILGSEEG